MPFSDKPFLTTHHFAQTLLLGLVVISPLLVVPLFVNFLVASKILILLVAALSLIAVWIATTISTRTLHFHKHALTWPLIAVGMTTVFSTFFTQNYPVENVLGWGGIYGSMILIALLGSVFLKPKSAEHFENALSVSSLLIALFTLTQVAGFGVSHLFQKVLGVEVPHTALFNLTGSLFIAAQLLAVMALGMISKFAHDKQTSPLMTSSLVVTLVALGVAIYQLLPGKEASPLLLPYGVSWSLALDVLRNVKSALIGVGPEYYTGVYNQFRPAWTNSETWWGVPFSQGANVPLTLVVTTGLLGVASWLALVLTAIKHSRVTSQAAFVPMVVTVSTLITQLIFPTNVVILTLQAVALAYWIALDSHTRRNQVTFTTTSPDTNTDIWFKWVLPTAAVALVVGFGGYGIGRAYQASYHFYQASMALQKNEVVKGYQLQQAAVNLNPYLSSYRSNYALTNLAIASALANKTNPTAEERAQVAQLLQQAIREGRAAALLRPDMSGNWQVLAQVYRNLIGTAEGADQWTVNSYVTAIETAPLDPNLRFELGGVFYQAQAYEQAAAFFNQAIQLDPTMPNAYYNLANTLKQMNQLSNAEQVYQKLLTLLQPNSEEYLTTEKELQAVQEVLKKMAETQRASGSKNAQNSAAANQQANGTTPAAQPAASPLVPSINEQYVSQPASQVVNDPSTQPLTVGTGSAQTP